MVIINDQSAWIKASEGPTRNIKGTYLITFENNITINGTVYNNPKGMLRKKPSSASSTTLNITGHQEVLSLPYLHRLNIENVRYINKIKSRLNILPATSGFVLITILIIYFIVTRLRKIRIKKRQNHILQATIDSYRRAEDDPHLSAGGVNTVTHIDVRENAEQA